MKTNANDFRPDSTNLWTASEAQLELTGFKFSGPGWYVTDTETILVIPAEEVENPFIQSWPASTRFFFYFYDGRNPAHAFNSIVNAPTRVHE